METFTTATFSSAVALPTRRLAMAVPYLHRLTGNRSSRSSPSATLSTVFLHSPSFLSGAGGSVSCDFYGVKVRPECLNPAVVSSSRGKRGVVTMVSCDTRDSSMQNLRKGHSIFEGKCVGTTSSDLASYLFKNRIVYLGMSLVPSVTELILAEFLYLQYEDAEKPIYFYINSTGTTKGGEKLGYETEAFAIYDVMRYVKPPIFTLCVGNAWGEAALLLAAGAKGNRSALPSSTIMIKQPIARFQGQASDIEVARKEVKNVKAELVKLYAKHMGKTEEQIEDDIRRPKYFSPSEAVEYGIIDKVLYNERSGEDRGVVSDLKKARLI